MIVLNLLCSAGHRFEGWFASSEAFTSQQERKILSCPVCGTQEVSRLPSAPHVQTQSAPNQTRREAGEALLHRLRELISTSEDVGTHFPEEARRIHYGDAEERPIRGQATLKDTLSLLEEGITVLSLPAKKEDLH